MTGPVNGPRGTDMQLAVIQRQAASTPNMDALAMRLGTLLWPSTVLLSRTRMPPKVSRPLIRAGTEFATPVCRTIATNPLAL